MYEPQKELGQNFLTDKDIAYAMVEALRAENGSDVIEIGSGLGMVTDVLAQRIRDRDCTLHAVELDARFGPKLDEMFLTEGHVRIITQDILEFLPKFTSTRSVHVIGSLPFYITSPIVHAIVKMLVQPLSAVLLVQKEVAQKIAATAPDNSYLASLVQSFYTVEYIQSVPNTKFRPVPEVDGGIIALYKKPDVPHIPLPMIQKYEGFLHRAFRSPRKMLNKVFKSDELAKMQIVPNLRPEAVSAVEWLEAFRVMESE